MRDRERVFYRHFHKGRRLKATIATKMIDDHRVAVGVAYVDKADRLTASRRFGRKLAEERLNVILSGKKPEKPYMGFIVEHTELANALKHKTFFLLAPSWANHGRGVTALLKRTYNKVFRFFSN